MVRSISDHPSPRWSVADLPSWVPTAAVIAVVAALLVARFGPAWGLLIGGAVLVPLERRFARHDQPVLRRGVRVDVLHFLFTHLLELACLLAAAGLTYVVLSPLTIEPASDWIASQSMVVQVLLAMALFQITYYAEHRLAHRWSFLWRFHAVHHSSEHLDWLAAPRLHPAEAFVGGFVMVPVFVVLGFVPVTVGVVASLQTIWAIFVHSNVRFRLRPLDRVWITPEYHHWHHSNEPEARNKNFGLPLLDTLFGTYYMPQDRRPARYGIDEPMPDSYVGQLLQPFRSRSRTGQAGDWTSDETAKETGSGSSTAKTPSPVTVVAGSPSSSSRHALTDGASRSITQ
jgi:sterol desaturase/sphingolipid hydroxylase (fatty acid hydroxylase superfamily)